MAFGCKKSEVSQSCPILCDPIDCSLPGSSVHGIFQATVLEWGAIAFSLICHTLIELHMAYDPASPTLECIWILHVTKKQSRNIIW